MQLEIGILPYSSAASVADINFYAHLFVFHLLGAVIFSPLDVVASTTWRNISPSSMMASTSDETLLQLQRKLC
jgi:hypothetical protein